MKNFQIYFLTLLIAGLGSCGAFAQTTVSTGGTPTISTPDKDIYSDRDKVEKRTGAFSPTYFTNPENRHYQIRLEVTPNGLRAAEVVRAVGRMPYVERTGGEVSVVLRDAQGKTLDSYFIEDPTQVRSCEEQTAGARLPEGTNIYLPLPNSREVSTMEISGTLVGGETTMEIQDLVRQAGQ